jgi:quercetin dioxygenase-like cupin family protein
MLHVDTTQLELTEVTWESAPNQRVNVTFPINRFAGSEDSAVVYFEIAPGDRLPLHTDSAEEILYIVSGEAETQLGEERGRVSAGDLVVIPSMVPHGARNIGSQPVKVVGFFSESEITSTFNEPIQPLGTAQVVQGAPVPSPA